MLPKGSYPSLPDSKVPSPAPQHGDRIASLDGLRGIAILMVLFAHNIPQDIIWPVLPLEWLRKTLLGGWVGVDLFFVLSGFLITGILIHTKNQEHYFRNFCIRRVLRIFPLYYGVLTLIFFIAPLLELFEEAAFSPLRRHQVWLWLYSSNFGMYFCGRDAFQSNQIGLLHFWSLSVEEHFYLVWPAVVYLTGRRGLRAVCVSCIVGALALRCVAVLAYHESPYFFVLTPTRIDALAIGAILASIQDERGLHGWSKRASALLTISLAVLVSFMYLKKGLWPNHPFIQTIGLTIIGLAAGAALVLTLTATSNTWAGRILSHGALPFFGKYSYGMYVIHAAISPVLILLRPPVSLVQTLGSPLAASLTAFLFHSGVTLVLAMMSWHLYEYQFLKLKRYFGYGAAAVRSSPP